VVHKMVHRLVVICSLWHHDRPSSPPRYLGLGELSAIDTSTGSSVYIIIREAVKHAQSQPTP